MEDYTLTFDEMCVQTLLDRMKILEGSEPESLEYWERALSEEYFQRLLPTLLEQARGLYERYMALQEVRKSFNKMYNH